MGSNFKKKPKNSVTISRGGDVPPRKIDPATGITDRSFAQPNPVTPPTNPAPKTHASAEEAVEALERHSQKGRSFTQEVMDEVLENGDGDESGNDEE
jgi:hypothetical protein